MVKAKDNRFPRFKDRALVRSGNTIYFGDPGDDYVAMLQIITSHDFGGTKIADKVMVQIMSTDETLPLNKRLVKSTDKTGLYNALAISDIWLKRLETGEEKAENLSGKN